MFGRISERRDSRIVTYEEINNNSVFINLVYFLLISNYIVFKNPSDVETFTKELGKICGCQEYLLKKYSMTNEQLISFVDKYILDNNLSFENIKEFDDGYMVSLKNVDVEDYISSIENIDMEMVG